jgi:hypothetical protein
MQRNKSFFYILIFLIWLLIVNYVHAAGPPPPPPTGGPACWPPPCAIPIDGGIGFLMAAGIGYGAKKIYDSLKKAD